MEPLVKKKIEGTVLEERNIALLKEMFKDDESYRLYMGTIFLLRNQVSNNIGDTCDFERLKKHPMFPILKTLNELVGALLTTDYIYSGNGIFIKK